MPLSVTCPTCGKTLRVTDRLAGKRAKCPCCGGPVVIPTPDASEDAGAYELADPDAPSERGASRPAAAAEPSPLADPTPVKPASIPTPERCTNCGAPLRSLDHHCPACGYLPRTGGFAQLDGDRFGDPDRDLARRRHRLTRRLRLAGWAALVLLIVGGVVWYLLGPARGVHVVTVQPAYAARALAGLEIREPYSLFTGTGDRSLGVKAPQSQSNPIAGVASVDEVHSFGGRDELYVLQPDARGDQVLIVLDVRQSLLDDLGMRPKYDLSIRASDITVADDRGRSQPATLLQERFEDAVPMELSGASGSPMNLFPPDIAPTSRDTQDGAGGPDATGTLRYAGPDAQGEVTFTSMARLSRAPGTRGLSATGQLTADYPGRIRVTYDYQGDAAAVRWADTAEGWWATSGYTEHHSLSPWTRHRVALLVPRPEDASSLTVSLAGEPVATVSTERFAMASAPTPREEEPPAASPSAAAPSSGGGGSGPIGGMMSYFEILAEARQRARGLTNMSHMQQLGLGLRMYLDQERRWPDRLTDLRSVLDGVDRLLVNEQTGVTPGYIYEKPPPGADPATTPVLWQADETGQKDRTAPVLYADGHLGPDPRP